MASKRDFTTEQGERVGAAAEYLGKTWDEAANTVLALMKDYQWTFEQAIDLYRLRRAREVRAVGSVRETHVYEVTAYRVPPVVMETAMGIAGGDISRLRIEPDGSIIVVNQSRRPE